MTAEVRRSIVLAVAKYRRRADRGRGSVGAQLDKFIRSKRAPSRTPVPILLLGGALDQHQAGTANKCSSQPIDFAAMRRLHVLVPAPDRDSCRDSAGLWQRPITKCYDVSVRSSFT